MHLTVSCNSSSSNWAKQRLSPATDGWLEPVPTLIRQTTGVPSFGQVLSTPVSSVEQSPLGPAQWGQSPAVATDAHTSHTIDVFRRFMHLIPFMFPADTIHGPAAADDDPVVDEERRADDAVVEFVEAGPLILSAKVEHGRVSGVVAEKD